MKHIVKWIGKAAVWMLGISMLFAVLAPVSAASGSEIDLAQTGTITLTLKTGSGETVSGGAVTLYQAAALTVDGGEMAYSYTEAFALCGAELNVEDTSLPAALAAYAQENSVSGVTADIGSDGTVTFSDLELGLYLIVQTTASADYETISPFVVTVPTLSDGEWVYQVDASPKVGVVTPTEPADPSDPSEPTTEPSDPSDPSEPTTEPSEPTTEPTTEPTEPQIPQTGQLNWPVPVLAVCGMLLFAAGWILKRFGKNGADT